MSDSALEWLTREIVAKAQDAVVVADRKGEIRLWNAGAEAMFGYAAEEALGRTLDLIIPERLRERHWTGYDGAMARGTTRYAGRVLAVPAVRKDGSSLSVEFTVTLVHEPSGELFGPAAIIRDVTARWEEDRKLKKRIAELEAKTP
jgi:PAS domain S-box-containing protein